jgi:hypothetical protein
MKSPFNQYLYLWNSSTSIHMNSNMFNLTKVSFKACALILTLFISSFVACKKDIPLEPEVSETSLCLVEIDGKFQQHFLDQMPIFINGGDNGFLNELSKNISYPLEARENGKSGKVTVQYDIEKDGSVNNIRIILDPGFGMGEASKTSMDLIMVGKPYSPGILNGVPVKVRKEIQIIFRLE